MNKIALIIITLALIAGIGVIIFSDFKSNESTSLNSEAQNIKIKNGIQYINITAKGGYWPRISEAKANIPTQLIVHTNDTYDCSAALVMRSVGFQKILAPTGTETINLGTPRSGQTIQGLCSMGMYGFQIKFN